MKYYMANGASFIADGDMCGLHLPFEPETIGWCIEVMAGRRGTFIDIGANTGWYSIPIAAAGHDVVAYEPNPNVFRRLGENAALNKVSIDRRMEAVSDAFGTRSLWVNPKVPLTSGGSLEGISSRAQQCVTVLTTRLDDEHLNDVSLIKIDIEGHELPALSGAEATIERYRPHLVLEANDDSARSALGGWCEDNGYSWRSADERNMLCSPES